MKSGLDKFTQSQSYFYLIYLFFTNKLINFDKISPVSKGLKYSGNVLVWHLSNVWLFRIVGIRVLNFMYGLRIFDSTPVIRGKNTFCPFFANSSEKKCPIFHAPGIADETPFLNRRKRCNEKPTRTFMPLLRLNKTILCEPKNWNLGGSIISRKSFLFNYLCWWMVFMKTI